ncbi:MAG: hypothetical protein JJ863_19965 [Deltaproteobacteria bacterium]|nr:hypothetical protein [Deltaproteobacteria bacterium]
MIRLFLLTLALVAVAAPAGAQDCAERAAEAIGADVLERNERFALPGRPEIFPYTYPAESCVAFLAVSRPEQDLDLHVLAPSGLELERDTAHRAWAYGSHCGVAGQRVHATVSTHVQGRFELLVLRGAPPERPDLGRRIGDCFSGEPGRANDPVAHRSPEEDERELTGAVERVAVGLGWPTPRTEHGRLRDGRASSTLGVEAGRCYLVVVRSTDPTVVAEAVLPGDRWRTAPHRRAILRGCPDVDATLELFVGGAADAAYVVGIAELPRPSWAPPSSAGAAALATWGAEPRIVGRFHLRAGDRMAVTHEPGGECVTLSAVPASGDLGDLRVSIVGGSSDPSPDAASMVHHCGHDGALALEVGAARGAGEGWLLEWTR